MLRRPRDTDISRNGGFGFSTDPTRTYYEELVKKVLGFVRKNFSVYQYRKSFDGRRCGACRVPAKSQTLWAAAQAQGCTIAKGIFFSAFYMA
jgi:hypothetical protein